MLKCSYMSIYDEIKKPIISLAPMEDVTDTVFRQIVNSIQRPDLFYTEFVNVEGLSSEGREKVINRLKYNPIEKPLIAQLWGTGPDNFFKSAKEVKKLGFDGVDINMGCSVRKVVKKNAGSGLMREDRDHVKSIIESTKKGAEDLPVSVKTRLGWASYDMDWVEFLLKQELDVLTFNTITVRGSKAKYPNWGVIRDIVKMRDEMSRKTLIFGNGGVLNVQQAKKYAEKYGVDGVMIGRAALANPWLFSKKKDEVLVRDSIKKFKEHVLLFQKTWGSEKNPNSLRKYIKSYISGFGGSRETRERLMECSTIEEFLSEIDRALK